MADSSTPARVVRLDPRRHPRVRELSRGTRTVTLGRSLAGAEVVAVDYPAETEFDTHRHESSFLCLVSKGGYTEWVGSRHRSVPSGSDCTYAAGSEHAVRTGSHGARVLHVTDPLVRDWDQSQSHLRNGLLWQINAELCRCGDAILDDATLVHVASLMLELRPRITSGHDHGWLRKSRARIREGYKNVLQLEALATEAGVHVSHFARAFRGRYGMTAGEYLRRVRVAAAVKILRENRLPLSAVALEVGFTDQSHMGRYFKRYLHRTPKSFQASD